MTTSSIMSGVIPILVTPFDNKKVKGWPTMTIVNGNIVMRDGELIGKPEGKPILFNRKPAI